MQGCQALTPALLIKDYDTPGHGSPSDVLLQKSLNALLKMPPAY